jgi:hypothetical protein
MKPNNVRHALKSRLDSAANMSCEGVLAEKKRMRYTPLALGDEQRKWVGILP